MIKADWRILLGNQIDVNQLRQTGRRLALLLVMLWVTGILLIAFKPGLDLALIVANPKISAKITGVTILTLNGALLHLLVLSKPQAASETPSAHMLIIMLLGVVSSVSWVYASLLGAARIVAPLMDYQSFMAVYLSIFAFALPLGLVLSKRLQHPFNAHPMSPPH